MTEAGKEALTKFLANPEIEKWVNGTTLKESTRNLYVVKLLTFLKDEPPAKFLKKARANPKQTSIEIKGRLAEIYRKSQRQAFLTKYAVKSFVDFYETDVHMNGKLTVRRVRGKPALSWENAEKIIAETDEPYRSLFRFMLWAGLGEDEVMEIQNDGRTTQEPTGTGIQASIEGQRGNEKPYVKFDLEPRKSTEDKYFTLTPKDRVPKFPLNTKQYVDRGNHLIDPHDMQVRWRLAAKKVHIWKVGLGPHTLRSAFKSQCNRAHVPEHISEFCMGHGADKYGYERPTEQDLANELVKMWEYTQPATKQEVEATKDQLQDQKASQEESINKLMEIIDQNADEIRELKNMIHGQTKSTAKTERKTKKGGKRN